MPVAVPIPGIGNAQDAVDAFTDAERADIRYLCGFSMYGNSASSFAGFRFFEAYGTLEYRLTNAAPAEIQFVRQMVAEAQPLRTGILGAAANLDTDIAAVWTRNRREVADRKALFNDWRRELCDFLGVPPGPGLQRQSGDGRIVV